MTSGGLCSDTAGDTPARFELATLGGRIGMANMVRRRWVIVFEDNVPPVLWSTQRETLDAVCRHPRRTCPKVRVEWEPATLADDAVNCDEHDE